MVMRRVSICMLIALVSLPEGSSGGEQVPGNDQPGVLGMGQRASTGITTFNQVSFHQKARSLGPSHH